MSNAADKSTATQIDRYGGFLWLNPIAISVVICIRAGGRAIWSKAVLVWSRLEIFVDSGQQQRLKYFRVAEKRDRPIRRSYGGVLARFRYWDDQ